MNRTIIVVGSANLDLVCNAAKIPSPGETVWGDRFQTFHGGKGANQAVAAGRLGADVRMVAKVGSDDFGDTLREGLRASRVNTTDVSTAEAIASGVALISVDADGQNSIIVIPGANGQLRPEDLDRCRERLESAGIILTQLEIPMETVDHLSRIAYDAGVPLILDPAPARPIPAEILRRVTYLTPNESETVQLCGMAEDELTLDTAGHAADKLLATGAKNVILKMGGQGVYIATADGLRRTIDAFKVPVVDTTAAGDAFNGGLAAALMRGEALEEAVEFAVAVAAVSVTRAGAQTAMPTSREVTDLLETYAQTTNGFGAGTGKARC
ncbi:MAG TPA: ribokinase [Acidobacteriaceae bacterium]